MKKVSIIILNWNGLKDTTECLNSLKKMDYPEYEVIIVDNASKGNDVKILKENFGDYIYLIENDKNYGFAEGCNIGIKYALENSNPDFILLLNNDTVVAKDFLTELIKGMLSSPDFVKIAGPTMYYFNSNKVWSNVGSLNWISVSIQEIKPEIETSSKENSKFDFISGCCMLIKPDLFEEIGYFNEKLFTSYEDVDLCLRTKMKGYHLLYVPKAKLWHKVSTAIGTDSTHSNYHQIRNRIWIAKKYLSLPRYLLFTTIYLFFKIPIRLLRLLAQGKTDCLKAYLKGLKDGTLFKL